MLMTEEQSLRMVVKVGTSTLTRDNGSMNLRAIDRLAMVLADLHGQGHQVILVSSGAIGVGVGKLGLGQRPRALRMKQAVAAVGQCELMHIYDKFFGEYGATVAQILLTDEDVDDPRRAEHLENTFEALLELGCIPVVNENDSVSSAEIETGTGQGAGGQRHPVRHRGPAVPGGSAGAAQRHRRTVRHGPPPLSRRQAGRAW